MLSAFSLHMHIKPLPVLPPILQRRSSFDGRRVYSTYIRGRCIEASPLVLLKLRAAAAR